MNESGPNITNAVSSSYFLSLGNDIELGAEYRKLHNEKLHSFCLSPNVTVIQLKVRRTGHVTGLEGMRNVFIHFSWKNLGEETTWKSLYCIRG